MSDLTFRDKTLIADVLEFDNGYVFSVLKNYEHFNKTTARNIIYGASGIDIFNNPKYAELSQQKCLERIWEEESNHTAGSVLRDLLLFYIEHYPPTLLEEGEKKRYARCMEVADRLLQSTEVSLPFPLSEQLKVLKTDIQKSISAGNPELCLDRLHTFATEYLRTICAKHEIPTANDKGQNYPLHNLSGSLQRFYRESEVVEAEFSLTALRNSIDLFSKYNDIRNDQSFAHPNKVLSNAEASYAVQIMTSTLTLIEKIEELIDEKEGRSWIHDVIPPTM